MGKKPLLSPQEKKRIANQKADAEKAAAIKAEAAKKQAAIEAQWKITIPEGVIQLNDQNGNERLALQKFNNWIDLIKSGKHPKSAAEQIGDCHYSIANNSNGELHIRLSGDLRAYFFVSTTGGNRLQITEVGQHRP